MDKLNYHMMVLARLSRGLTQEELAERACVGQGTLSKYETGIKEPTPESIQKIASALEYPEKFFYQPGQLYGFPPFHYRKRKKLSVKTLGRIVAEMNIRRMHVSKLMISYEITPLKSIPEIDLDEFQGRSALRPAIEEIARSIREMWMLGTGPISNMVEVIENHGGVVIPCDFGTDLLDAISQRIDGMPVLFFVNTNAPADRVRHTLAHELAHMLIHTTTIKDGDEMEREAEEFAGAFLLPRDEIMPQLRNFDLRHLANLKLFWKVSMSAIAVRADRLNLITPYQNKMFWIEMGRLGYRKREPNELPKEHPSLLRKMIEYHHHGLGYVSKDMAELLCMSVPEYNAMYGQESIAIKEETKSGHLRRVK